MARENGSSSPSNRLAERLQQNSKKVLSGSPSVNELPMKSEFKYKESMITRQSIGGGFSHRQGFSSFKTFFEELETSESVSLQFTEEVLKENGKR